MARVSFDIDEAHGVRVLVRSTVSAGRVGKGTWFTGQRTPVAVILGSGTAPTIHSLEDLSDAARAALARAGVMYPDPPAPSET